MGRLLPKVRALVWRPKWQRLLGRELEKAISLSWIMGTRDWLRTLEWSEAIAMEWALARKTHCCWTEEMQYLWFQLCWSKILISLILSLTFTVFQLCKERGYNKWVPESRSFSPHHLMAPSFTQRIKY